MGGSLLDTERMHILDWVGGRWTRKKIAYFGKNWVVVAGHGKNLHILEKIGWVGVFIAIADFFIIPPPDVGERITVVLIKVDLHCYSAYLA